MSSSDQHIAHRRLPYVGALDGIRAFSVVAVMLFHAGNSHVPGGFLGVDIFFVLSGFLITSLLVREEMMSSTVAILAFWGRRVRRLAPALLMVLVVTAIFVAYVATPGLFPTFRGDSWSSLGYVMNWRLILAKTSYWRNGLPSSALTHLWSLAIEEQFYVVWPMLVWGLYRLGRGFRTLAMASLMGAVASAVWMAVLFQHHVSINRLYYGTDTHVSGLLLGAALACVLARPRTLSRIRQHSLSLASGVAVVSLALCVFLVKGTSPWLYRGGFSVIALAVIVVLADIHFNPRRPVARLLSIAPLRFIGRISYGLYLWHYPIFLWLNGERSGLHSISLLVARFVVTFVVASASYYFVEQPIRTGVSTRRMASPATWVASLGAVLVLTTSLSAVGAVPAAPKPPSGIALHHPLKVLIVGDSIGFSLDWLGAPWAAQDDVVMTSAAIPGCGLMPFLWSVHHGNKLRAVRQCRRPPTSSVGYLTFWKQQLAIDHPNVVVIMAGRWEVHTLFRRGHLESIDRRAFRRELFARMLTASSVASSSGARVVWSTLPCSRSGENLNGNSWVEDSDRRLHLYNALVYRAARHLHEAVFNLNALLCSGASYQRIIDGVVVRAADGVHFSPTGAPWVVARLDHFLLRITKWNQPN